MLQRLFIWVEIPVSNMERAKTFYEQIFQVEMQSMVTGDSEYTFFPVQEQTNGGALVKGPHHKPFADGVTVYLDGKPDLATILSRVPEAGGQVIMEKTYAGPHAGYLGMFIDSEGNRIGLQHL
ncbi:VOC family protein [Brevibacillus fluminis]|uniref:VOC family protein n=1 Tax=Brevibacillus fluminis TaxID=511487 RepID=UPI003F8B3929